MGLVEGVFGRFPSCRGFLRLRCDFDIWGIYERGRATWGGNFQPLSGAGCRATERLETYSATVLGGLAGRQPPYPGKNYRFTGGS